MARKAALSLESLSALGAEKLAQIIVDEAEDNPAFRKRVTAALASVKGPDAVAKLIDRRLTALERARAMIAWEKERAFAEDLGATVNTIIKELAPLSPMHAVERLLRFVDSHGGVFDRIDDSSGRIQDVYWTASEALPDLVARLTPTQQARVLALLSDSLTKDTHGLARSIAVALVPHLPESVLTTWDAQLRERNDGKDPPVEIRQAIADARGDIDGYLALEAFRPAWTQTPLRVAERLLGANRLDEALLWVRKERTGGLMVATHEDLAEGRIRRADDLDAVRLEARILEAMKDRPAAQARRWTAFENTLNAGILRDYINKLDDFLEFDEMDKAFAVVAASPNAYSALTFLLEWPRLDLAAALVIDRRTDWDGRHYDLLGNAASALEDSFPMAATVLYRALIDDILSRGKSPAYGHAARYLGTLDALSGRLPSDAPIDAHEHYRAGLKKNHGRKLGFWSLVDGNKRR